MAFIQPCFIRKNTPELRKKLEELGYNRHPSYGDNEYLYLNRGFYHTNVVGYSEEIERMVDCGNNEELFLAIAALRDDTDYMQWFVSQSEKDSPKVFIKSTTHSCTQSLAYIHRWDWRCSKATVEEIMEHFK